MFEFDTLAPRSGWKEGREGTDGRMRAARFPRDLCDTCDTSWKPSGFELFILLYTIEVFFFSLFSSFPLCYVPPVGLAGQVERGLVLF